MSRSGYSDHYGDDFNNQMELYRSTVKQAIYGKRGQAFLRTPLPFRDLLISIAEQCQPAHAFRTLAEQIK